MPLFSVIIPVYNRAALVERTLTSVYAQDFADFEIVAVDDGSTDDSFAVLRRHEAASKGHLRVFPQINKGLGATRNAAARESCGEYLAFIDSDDLWFPWALAAAAQVIRRFDKPSFLCGNFIELSDDVTLAGPPRTEPAFTHFPTFLDSRGRGFSWCPSAAIVRADIFRQAGGFSEIRFNCEDQDFWLKIDLAPGFVPIDSPPTTALRRGGSHASMVRAYANTVGRRGTGRDAGAGSQRQNVARVSYVPVVYASLVLLIPFMHRVRAEPAPRARTVGEHAVPAAAVE